jgi:hypothetical protein
MTALRLLDTTGLLPYHLDWMAPSSWIDTQVEIGIGQANNTTRSNMAFIGSWFTPA